MNTQSSISKVEVGQVFSCSWGYDQTNVDFYQVVGVTAKSVKLREIKQSIDWENGSTSPVLNQFTDDVIIRRFNERYDFLKIAPGQYARIWDGKPESFTGYA